MLLRRTSRLELSCLAMFKLHEDGTLFVFPARAGVRYNYVYLPRALYPSPRHYDERRGSHFSVPPKVQIITHEPFVDGRMVVCVFFMI